MGRRHAARTELWQRADEAMTTIMANAKSSGTGVPDRHKLIDQLIQEEMPRMQLELLWDIRQLLTTIKQNLENK